MKNTTGLELLIAFTYFISVIGTFFALYMGTVATILFLSIDVALIAAMVLVWTDKSSTK
jgi:hypothetical protein